VSARGGGAIDAGQLLETFRRYLTMIAKQQLPGVPGAKLSVSDLVQETLVRGLEGFPQFRGSSRPELAGWLRRILRNYVVNYRAASTAVKRDLSREQSADDNIPDPWSVSPSRQAMSCEQRDHFEAALRRLPTEAQEVIRLRHQDDQTFAAIGASINKSEEAARKIWFRSIERLQRELKSESA